MQKLILVKGNDTEELDMLLNDGWVIKDYKPICNTVSASVSCGASYSDKNSREGSVYAYVLLIKGNGGKLFETNRI